MTLTEGLSPRYIDRFMSYIDRMFSIIHISHLVYRDELYLGHSKKSAVKSMEQVLMGEKREDLRAQLPQHSLSVEQQVAALIDQATDSNILGRVYAGWEPWV